MQRTYRNPASEAFYRDLIGQPENFPVSFYYDAQPIHGFPAPLFRLAGQSRTKSPERREDCLVLEGPQGLTVTVKAAYWVDFGVTEWTLRFENRGDADTGLLSDVCCCELDFAGGAPVLRGILGDLGNQYRPYATDLTKQNAAFESLSGRPTHGNFPYFNLEHDGGGVLLALGWAGSWSAWFHAENGTTHFRARSTVGLSLRLHPGEHFRTALCVIAPYYVRDEDAAMNFWRDWFVRCNLPKADAQGHALQPFSTCFLALDTGLPNSDGSISERSTTWRPSMEKMLSEDVKTDFRWFDAGWYSDPAGNTVERDWWGTVGSWELDPVKWPGKSFLESTDFAREHGMKTLMWFEPERVTDPEALARNYGYKTEWAIPFPGRNLLTNNIGDPACLRWTTERVCRVLRDNKVEMYREDNNSDPGVLWRALDETDGRHGATECRVVEAHYKLWDDIIETTKSIGGCAFCDSCASGGGRNDLESLRRGVPMLRSDSDRTTTALRLSMTSSFNRWIPFCGANTREKLGQLDAKGRSDVYTWRASYLPALNVDSQYVQDPDQDFSMLRFGLREWDRVKPYLLADFYVLTPWHTPRDRSGYTAYTFYNPDEGRGVLFVFRMEDCESEGFALTLPYAGDGCTLTDADTDERVAYLPGMTLTLPEKRTARLFFVENGHGKSGSEK